VLRAALLAGFLSLPAFAAEKTLWLVRPLYPGQEALAGRTEQAIDKLTTPANRPDTIIGHKELAAALAGKKAGELPCFNGETRCADPIDPFVASLGFDRVVLVQGGQDETGFKFKVVSYEPASGKVSPATASDANLGNALIGAIAKVVPVTSTIDVTSTPPGATVYVDDKKVGVTPLNAAQVLPGERVVRIDLKLHQPIEETVVVPMRGIAKLDKTLQKVAARIVITAQPAGATISVDGNVLGKDKVDRGIEPGTHTIRITAQDYKSFEQSVQVKADEQFVLDKSLEPIPGKAPPPQVIVIQQPANNPPAVRQPPPQPPPPPLSLQDQLYERKNYVLGGFEYQLLRSSWLPSTRFGSAGRTTSILSPASGRRLLGGTAEFGIFGRYLGLVAFGVSVTTNDENWSINVGYNPANSDGMAHMCETGDSGMCKPSPINAHVLLATIRAIQPQIRVQLWRFMLQLQVGLELRLGQIQEAVPISLYDGGGFFIYDLLLGARAGLRVYVVDGMFHWGQYHWSWAFASPLVQAAENGHTVSSPTLAGDQSFNFGIGYAF
jgi:hypothetical protein